MSPNDKNNIDTIRAVENKERIWELDALRGLFLIGMIVIHVIFDVRYFLDVPVPTSRIFDFVQNNGGVLFILISGICVTLGSRFVKRGLIVLGCGFAVTLVTFLMYLTGFSGVDIIIYWGILHLLGASMLLYGLIRKAPLWLVAVMAVILIAGGYMMSGIHYLSSFPQNLLLVLGAPPDDLGMGDYFPLLPYFGWFTAGVFLGKTVYRNRKSLLPRFPYKSLPVRILSFVGKHSLWIYLLHQPVVSGIIALIGLIRR